MPKTPRPARTPSTPKATAHKADTKAKSAESLTQPMAPLPVPNRDRNGVAGRRRPDGQHERGYKQTPADEIEPTNVTLGGTRQGERAPLQHTRGHILG